MFLTVKTLDNGSMDIKKVPEEEMFNNSYSPKVRVFKAHNIIFDNGFIKSSGREMKRLNSRSFGYFREIQNNSEIITNGIRGLNRTAKIKIPTCIMRKYYDQFVNIGSIESAQDNPDYYKIPSNTLFFDPNPSGAFKKLCFSGNIQYIGESYDLT